MTRGPDIVLMNDISDFDPSGVRDQRTCVVAMGQGCVSLRCLNNQAKRERERGREIGVTRLVTQDKGKFHVL
jgi:hypothetical protein